MATCFVMQPFDGATFDKRYDDVFAPAITDAGLEPYRVDRDPKVSIPIEDIENGIRNARLCLAEITMDNPNVWFELGFAIAVPREVVLVCADTRETPFPFDVQHRNIIRYKSESPRDFKDLQTKITGRIEALLKKESEIDRFSRLSPLVETEGLKQHEIVCLVTVAQNCLTPDASVAPRQVKEDMARGGFTDIAVSLGLHALLKKQMIENREERDFEGDIYQTYIPTEAGLNWLMKNEDRIVLRDFRGDIPF